MTDVRRQVLRTGDVGHLAILLLQHVVAALLHDAAFDRFSAHVLGAGSIAAGRALSRCSASLVVGGADAGSLASAGSAAT